MLPNTVYAVSRAGKQSGYECGDIDPPSSFEIVHLEIFNEMELVNHLHLEISHETRRVYIDAEVDMPIDLEASSTISGEHVADFGQAWHTILGAARIVERRTRWRERQETRSMRSLAEIWHVSGRRRD